MSLAGKIFVPDPNVLAAEFVSKNLGAMRTVEVRSTTYRITRDRAMAATMPREHVIVNILEAGRWTGRLAGRDIAMRVGDVLLSQATNQLDLVMEDATWLGLLIPRVFFERHMRWQARYDGTVYPAGTVHAAILGGLVRALCSLPDALPPREIARATASSLSLLLACLGGSVPAAAVEGDDKEEVARAIRRFIVDRLADPELGIELLCHEFGLSRSALYRIMGENGDVATVIRSLRLQAIARDMLSPRDAKTPLPEIARRWGFADERTFRRAFQREFGCSPSDLRSGNATAPLLGPVGTEFQHWFLGL